MGQNYNYSKLTVTLASFLKEVDFGNAERRRIAECVNIRANTEVRPYVIKFIIIYYRKNHARSAYRFCEAKI